MIDPGLEGRVALVTGANHGIGAAVAQALAAQRAAVFLTFLRAPPDSRASDPGTPEGFAAPRAAGPDAVLAAIRSAGGTADSLEADLADPALIPVLFDEATTSLGPVEILVHNAAVSEGDTFLTDPLDRWGREQRVVDAPSHDAHFAVNSRATALLIAQFARRHIARGADRGRIVTITSAGSDGFPSEISYGASKAALESYTKSAAWELGPHGVTSNIVHPPATDTGWMNDAVREHVSRTSPLRHIGRPAEVAEVVVFLCSDQARYVTGQRIQMY